jgi:type VI secretion system secreted protein Hcp
MAGKSYFLCKIDTIDGESPDPKYPGYFEIDSWGFNVMMHGTQQTGAGMAVGKATFGDFNCTKSVDKASPKLMEACAKGTHLGSATLVARKQGRASGELEEFATWKFTNLVITSVQSLGSGVGGGLPSESLGFAYEKLEFKYDVKKADGSSEGWQGASFDSKTNLAA